MQQEMIKCQLFDLVYVVSQIKDELMLKIAGSPIHPKPKAVTVIPSCVADRYSSSFDVTCLAAIACLFPSSIS